MNLSVTRAPVRDDGKSDPDAITAVNRPHDHGHGIDTLLFLCPIRILEMVVRGLWIHVDACVGGYFLPFAQQLKVEVLERDFRVSGGALISANLYKYGCAPTNASMMSYRS